MRFSFDFISGSSLVTRTGEGEIRYSCARLLDNPG